MNWLKAAVDAVGIALDVYRAARGDERAIIRADVRLDEIKRRAQELAEQKRRRAAMQ